VSSKFLSAISVNHKREQKRGDPALLDRLSKAMGAYQMRTGRRVESQDLAKAAGLGSSTMTDITTLNRKVTIQDAVAFADFLGVEFAWLAAGRGPMVRNGAGETSPPTVLQESSADSQEVSHHGTQRKGQRRSDGRGQAG
jgi:hypothetical protein